MNRMPSRDFFRDKRVLDPEAVAIQCIGAKPGEKLAEELMTDNDLLKEDPDPVFRPKQRYWGDEKT